LSATDRLSRIRPYLERALENEYAQERLRDAAVSAHAAYRRATGRKAAQAARDKRLQRQVRQALSSLREAGAAIQTGRKKPKSRPGRRLFVLVGFVGAGGLAAREGLRRRSAPENAARRAHGDAVAAPPAEQPLSA
jgi:hypothetical protein